ncbi:MAG: hypothetical protein Q9M36_06490 [Sulfurovum sp.]|nr:hypothetical protein [Sulfurovum sp.]
MAENPQGLRKLFLKKSLWTLLPIFAFLAYNLFGQIGEDALFLLVFYFDFWWCRVNLDNQY